MRAGVSGPARYYTMDDDQTRIGFISPHSHNFCHTCNRVRATEEGRRLLCLGNEHSVDLRAVLRAPNYNPELLKQTIANAMTIKPERHHFDHGGAPAVVRFLNITGG
jgi:cyclic pyranopterin phosphate synthase